MSRLRLRGCAARFSLILVSTLAGLLLCEGLLRAFVRVGSFRWVGDSAVHWNQADEARDYALTPGYTGRIDAPEFTHHVRVNSLGFRGSESGLEPASAAETGPVFVLGDSFVFGIGAEEFEAIPARLEAHLSALGRPSPVWNLGIPSHSSPQYRRTLELYRQKTRPRAVVVGLYIGRLPGPANDLWGAVSFEEKRRRAVPALDHPLEEAPVPDLHRRRRFNPSGAGRDLVELAKRRSAIYAFAASRLAPTIRAWRYERRELLAAENERFELGWTILRRDLDAMRRLTDADGVPLLLVHIPESPSVISGDWQVLDRLRALADELELDLIDFRDVFTLDDGRELYYPMDGHLKPIGYDRVARSIAEALVAPAREVDPG